MTQKSILLANDFDQIDYKKIRLIHQASRLGPVHIAVFDDSLVERLTGKAPKFPLEERVYFLENIRYVTKARPVNSLNQLKEVNAQTFAAFENDPLLEKITTDKELLTFNPDDLTGYPEHDYDLRENSNKKVIVTGCFDFFHTGHVRFFEEASEYGDLYVALGNDKNLELLKGPGHPMFSQDHRKYVAGAISFVKEALVTTGSGWLDAEPEIQRIKPDRYITNEDGDKEIKRDYCQANGIEYIVLKRLPKPGLTRRTSTNLRGF